MYMQFCWQQVKLGRTFCFSIYQISHIQASYNFSLLLSLTASAMTPFLNEKTTGRKLFHEDFQKTSYELKLQCNARQLSHGTTSSFLFKKKNSFLFCLHKDLFLSTFKSKIGMK